MGARSSEEDEDINAHWDMVISYGVKTFKVDVKAMKRISRGDQAKQDAYHWVELHGVRANDEGWLFGGQADLIAKGVRSC
ncbi:MAG: hypothetical protein QHH80_08225 [Anaerolineae bacterium]|nr:hypothetical protein [Anaerolineae bacterium]